LPRAATQLQNLIKITKVRKASKDKPLTSRGLVQRFLTFFYLSTLLVTPKQSSTPYHWLTPLSKRIPFTFDCHIYDLPQQPLKLVSVPRGVTITPG